MNNKVPFPQANDLNKILSIINIDDINDLKDELHVSVLLGGVKPRQVNYYIAACQYLNIIDDNKNITSDGLKIRNATGIEQEVKLAVCIFKDEIFAKGYIQNLDVKNFMTLLKEYYPSYSEPMLMRRSQSAIAWIKKYRPQNNFKNISLYYLFKDEAISTVFFSNLLYGYKLDKNDVLAIIRETNSLDSLEYIIEKVSQLI